MRVQRLVLSLLNKCLHVRKLSAIVQRFTITAAVPLIEPEWMFHMSSIQFYVHNLEIKTAHGRWWRVLLHCSHNQSAGSLVIYNLPMMAIISPVIKHLISSQIHARFHKSIEIKWNVITQAGVMSCNYNS